MEFRPTLFHCNPIIILPLRRDGGAQHTKRHDHNILYRLLARPCDHTLRRNPGCSTTLNTYDKTTGAEPENSAPDIRLRRIIQSSAAPGPLFQWGKSHLIPTKTLTPPETPAARSYSTSAMTKLLPPMKIISSAVASSRARATASATLFTTSPSRPISAAREASSSAGSARMTAACVKM